MPALPHHFLRSHRLLAWVGGSLLLAVVGVLLVRHVYIQYSHPVVHTIAILPFNNLKNDPEVDFLGFSLADAIITQLGSLTSLSVRPSASILKYRNQVTNPRSVASELKVQELLTGNFLKDGDDLRITAQLIDIPANRILWREVMNFKYDRLLAIQDRVVSRILGGLRLTLTPAESGELERNLPSNAHAYEFYLRGIDQHSRGNFHLAREMQQKSLELDPRFAPAWAYLGKSYAASATREFGGRESYDQAQAAYTKALAIDPQQADAKVFLASLYTDTNRVEEAARLLRSVIIRHPDHAEAHWELGYAYRYAGMLQESVAECETARQLAPTVKINYAAFNSYLYLGHYDRFIASLLHGDESAFNLFYRGFAYYYLKDYSRATADFNKAYELESTFYTMLGKVLAAAIAGHTRMGLDTLNDVRRQMERRHVCDPEVIYKVAQCYAVLGDRESALRELEQSIGGGFFCYPYIQMDPLLNSLHTDRRYSALLAVARSRHERFKAQFFDDDGQRAYASPPHR